MYLCQNKTFCVTAQAHNPKEDVVNELSEYPEYFKNFTER